MSDPTYKLCDICGAECPSDTRISVATGWSPCPAGGPSEEDFEYLDLCPKHMAYAVMVLLREKVENPKTKNHEKGNDLVNWVKREISRLPVSCRR